MLNMCNCTKLHFGRKYVHSHFFHIDIFERQLFHNKDVFISGDENAQVFIQSDLML